MSAEKLKALVEQGNLINLNIVSDSLGNLLNEVAQLLVEQQRQIVALKKEVTEKVDKKDYNEFKDQWRADRDMILRSFPNFDTTLSKFSKESELKQEKMKQFIDQSLDQIVLSVDTRISQKISLLENEHSLFNQRIEYLEQKSRTNLPQGTQKVDIEGLKKRIGKLEQEMSELPNKGMSEIDIEKIKKEIESKIEEIKPKEPEIPAKTVDESDNTKRPHFSSSILEKIEPIEENEPSKDAISRIHNTLDMIEAKIDDQSKLLLSKVERKSDTTLVERMFEKLRLVIASIHDEVNNVSKRSDAFIQRKEMEDYVTMQINNIVQEEKASLIGKQVKCLACGRKKVLTHSEELKPKDLPLLVPHRPQNN